ncbi:MAG: hypothetical protein PHE27_02345 [Alphaproteobacteria bacterium]|nr:hypothetical protein [Alphaproteobacteria bacterium]
MKNVKHSIVEFHDGSSEEKFFDEYGRLHRLKEPAFISRDAEGRVDRMQFCFNGWLDREDAPADIRRLPNGDTALVYCKLDKWHNENGPAYFLVSPEGVIRDARYYLEGKEVEAPARRAGVQPAVNLKAYIL